MTRIASLTLGVQGTPIKGRMKVGVAGGTAVPPDASGAWKALGLGVFCYAASVFSYAPGGWVLGFMLLVSPVMLMPYLFPPISV